MGAVPAAFDASLWDEPITGIGLYTHRLFAALGQAGEPVERWGARVSGEVPRRRWSRTTWALGPLGPELARRRPSLFHAVGNFNLPLARVPGVPFVLTVHDIVPVLLPQTVSRAFRLQFQGWLARSLTIADQVLCVSHTTRDALLAHFTVDPAKVHVTPLGVDHVDAVAAPDAVTTAWLDSLGLPLDFLLYAGTLDARKNVGLLLDAVERLHRGGRRVTLVLAGQRWFGAGPVEATVERLRREGVDVRPLGYLADPVFYALMRRAGLFVFPSRYEGFGLPPLEAMRLGVPTVVSTAGSLPEVCGTGAAAVSPSDAAGLAETLERLLAGAPGRAALGQRGLAHARAFTWARTAALTRAAWDRARG